MAVFFKFLLFIFDLLLKCATQVKLHSDLLLATPFLKVTKKPAFFMRRVLVFYQGLFYCLIKRRLLVLPSAETPVNW